jgi:hypothetical protein
MPILLLQCFFHAVLRCQKIFFVFLFFERNGKRFAVNFIRRSFNNTTEKEAGFGGAALTAPNPRPAFQLKKGGKTTTGRETLLKKQLEKHYP